MATISVNAGGQKTEFVHIEKSGAHDIDVSAAEGADVHVIILESAPNDAEISMKMTANLEKEARIHWHIVTLGGARVEKTLEATLNGEHAESTIDWIFYAKDKERHSLNVRNIFAAKNGAGEIFMQGVAEDEGYVDCKGMIDIELGGGGTNTYLTQHVLMLDDTAKVDAIPGLEIKTNDVKASHSATVSRVSPEDLFYFASRGIKERDARKMYIEGFLESLTDRIPNAEYAEKVRTAIEQKYES